MKALFLLMATAMLSLNVYAGNGPKTTTPANHGNKYCVKLKDGKLVTMHDGTEMSTDVTLANGTQVKMDGSVIKKDGTKVMLKEGECIDKDGKIMQGKDKAMNSTKTPQ